MAVIQVSRIQQRRGRKNTGTGFPQLASGEIGWAIDAQELYIGNGAVSEGAPYVGNTKILTEHDNLLDFATLYQYQKSNPVIQTGEFITTPVERSLQERLDDIVSVRAFGALGNGIDDDTESLQRAINQLFLNDSTKLNPESRVILYFEPGEYLISEELKIPPYAHLVGAGIDSTIIRLTTSGSGGAILRTIDGNSTPGSYIPFGSMSYLTRPRFIHIESMTLETSTNYACVLLDNTDSTTFVRVKFQGVYSNGDLPETDEAGIVIRSASGLFRTENVQFHSCIWNETGYGIYSNYDHNDVSFNDCIFYRLYDGLNIGGGDFGSVNTKINSCYFDLVDRYGLYVREGYGNISQGNRYMNVGNDNNGYANATNSIIRFVDSNNQSIGDYFDRNSKLKDQTLYGLVAFKPNVETSGLIIDQTNYRKNLDETLVLPVEFFRLPLYQSATYVIDYVIDKTTLGSAVRTGKIHVTANLNAIDHHINDDFSYTGSATVESIVFSASLEDFDGDTATDTLVIKMFNPVGNGVGTVNYSYRMMTR